MILKTSKTVPDRLEPEPPAIGKGGNWWAYDDKTGKFADTGVKAKGDKGDKGADGHTLYVTAKLTGSYRNYKTTGIKLSVSVYYDGAEINIASTTAQFRLRGGLDIYKEWTAWGAYEPWIDKNNRNGTSLENEVKVTYKGLTAIAYARLEHVIDGKDGTSQYTKTTVDTRGLDPDTYYPVTFKITKVVVCDFLLKKDLDKKTADWQSHASGFTIDYGWEDSTEKWGAGISVRLIHRARYNFTTDNVIPAGNIGQTSQTNECYIYVRGGGVYPFLTSYRNGEPGPPAILHDKEYTVTISNKYTFTLPLKTSVTLPETERKRLERLQNEKAAELRAALDNANTLIEGLSTIRDEIRNGTVEPRKFKDIQYLLDALQKDGSFKTGILLSSVIALSGKDGNISSYLSGARGDGIAMLRAGVENFGGADGKTETAQTTIWSDGSVDIGDMHFVNEKDPEADHIDFTDKAAGHTYLQIGGAPKTESEIINAGTVIKEFKINDTGLKEAGTYRVDRFQSTESNREVKYTATVTAFARAVAEYYGISTSDGKIRYNGHSASAGAYLSLKVYSGTSSTVKYSTKSATVSASASVSSFEIDRMTIPAVDKMRQEDSASKTFTITAPGSYVATNDTVELSLIVSGSGSGDYETAQGSATDIKNYLPYTNRKSLVSIMRDKVAFFFSRQKYLLFNYLSDYLVKIVGNVLVQGDLKADRIDTDSINGGLPIKVLAHGVWNKSGNYVRYTSAVGGSISISRIGEGIYYLYYPTTWDYTHLSFLGTANSLTDTGTINTGNVAFSKAERGRVKVFTGDDSSGNDSDVYFQIILRDFSN